jgi:hypothetical protein
MDELPDAALPYPAYKTSSRVPDAMLLYPACKTRSVGRISAAHPALFCAKPFTSSFA